MRLLPLPGLVLLILASCSKPNEGPSEAPQMILDSLLRFDHSSIAQLFGEANLRDTTVNGITFTYLYPNTTREVRLQWTDYLMRSMTSLETGGIQRDTLHHWKTRDGIYIGMKMKEVEALNGQPFTLRYQKPWMISLWDRGALQNKVDLGFDPYNLAQRYQIPTPYVTQSGLNPQVIAIQIKSRYLPLTMSFRTITVTSGGKSYELPQVIDTNPDKQHIVDQINKDILGRIGESDFRWTDLKVQYEMDREVLGLRFYGPIKAIGGFPTYDYTQVFYDLTTGGFAEWKNIEFASLFSESGYWGFMGKYWFKEFDRKFKEGDCVGINEGLPDVSATCAGNIYEASFVDGNVVIAADEIMCECVKGLVVTVPVNELRPYLSERGERIVFEDKYFQQSPITQRAAAFVEETERDDRIFIRAVLAEHQDDTINLTIRLYEGDWNVEDPESEAAERYAADGWMTWYGTDDTKVEGSFSYEGIRVKVLNDEGSRSFEFLLAGEKNGLTYQEVYGCPMNFNQVEYNDERTPARILSLEYSSPGLFHEGKIVPSWEQ